jgi:hypothetical protein
MVDGEGSGMLGGGGESMETDDSGLLRMKTEWCDLDEAMVTTGQFLDQDGQWPWLSTHPQVEAAWEALTRPDHRADLEFRLAYFDGGARMNDWASKVTHKAIEVCRSRVSSSA